MDSKPLKKVLNYTRKHKNLVFVLGILGITSYGAYRAYNSPEMAKRRQRVMKLMRSLVYIVEALSNSAEAMAVVTRDLKEFILSDDDQVPRSLRQISKIAKSDDVSEPVAKITSALTSGILQGYQQQQSSGNSGFIDIVFDKLFTDAGAGFASAIAGSFARNLVMSFSSNDRQFDWLSNLLSDDKCAEVIGNLVQVFVSTAVAEYLEKTRNVNSYDEFFSGLTNPTHENRVKDILVAVCHEAVETFVKTSHRVLTQPTHRRTMQHESRDEKSVLANRMCSALSVPRNRRFLFELSGRVTFETMKSFQEIVVRKMSQSLRRKVGSVQVKVVDSGAEAMDYVRWKSSAAIAACLSLCLHIVNSPWLLVPP